MNDNEFLLLDRKQKIQSVINKYGENTFYISYSGGKDSAVLSWLADYAMPKNKIPRVYCDTGIELDMIRGFVKKQAEHDERIIIIKPKVPIKKMLEADGYPFKSKRHANVVATYQHSGYGKTVENYIDGAYSYIKGDTRFSCPKCLRYQFTPDFKLKISDKCCKRLKEEPLDTWKKENKRPNRMLGLMRDEGGRRASTKCMAFKDGGKTLSFHPLAAVTKEWEKWLIDTYNIPICDIYKPPYNFDRTGCKGCPFALDLQRNLDILEKYFPNERKQCEAIWKPVYDEYRRIGYRLKTRYGQLKLDGFVT